MSTRKAINERSENYFRRRNKNIDFTLIARDCVGGVLYHELGLRFLSPTINLFFRPLDFNHFCLHLKEYISSGVEEFNDDEVDYPVGLLRPNNLPPVRVDFMHYDSFTEAKNKWDERKARINFSNVFIVSTFCYPGEKKQFSEEIVKTWNEIKYKKVMLVDQNYGFENEYIIEKPEKCEEYAWLLYRPDKVRTWKRTFNKYDFIKFFNNK